jgi:hypothetical protein
MQESKWFGVQNKNGTIGSELNILSLPRQREPASDIPID